MLNNQRVIEEIRGELKKFLDFNETKILPTKP
jgi:hypothetical protein